MIDIIVPIYNVENYLSKCLDSIINQTYKKINIILVDDGSTDKSGIICDEYQKKDKRIKVIHQKNMGLSEARNVGLKSSNSKYVSFIDSDDYIDNDFIDYLYSNLIEYDSDISICSYYLESKKRNKKFKEIITITNSEKALKLLSACDYKYSFVAWNKLYKRSLFKNNLFRKSKLYEDMFTISKSVIKSKNICFSNLKKYHYLNKRPNSISNIKINNREFDRLEESFLLLSLINDKYPSLTEHFIVFDILNHLYICDKYLLIKEKNNAFINSTNELIRNQLLMIICSDYSFRRKMQILIFYFNKGFYYYYIRRKYE
jgi:glycosyltransferase involved in cell wall biosynthesis